MDTAKKTSASILGTLAHIAKEYSCPTLTYLNNCNIHLEKQTGERQEVEQHRKYTKH